MAGPGRGLSARLRVVSGLLAERFGRPELCAHETEPVRNLVLTILSQNTTDANRDRAYDRLMQRFPTLSALAAALTQTLGRFTLPHARNGTHDALPASSNGWPEGAVAQAAR